MFKKFFLNTSGATGIEYGLILGGVALTVSTGVFIAGGEISEIFGGLSAYMGEQITIKQ